MHKHAMQRNKPNKQQITHQIESSTVVLVLKYFKVQTTLSSIYTVNYIHVWFYLCVNIINIVLNTVFVAV